MDENIKKQQDLIKKIQKKRTSKVVLYVVSTRRGTGFQIADDAVRIIYEHLRSLGISSGDKIDFFLHSFGGVGTVPWKLANLIREFSKNFEVLIPYKAYSAATLIALGANRIVMHPMAELGPIDPKVGNEFNPRTPHGQPIGINVEDVVSYINFVKDFVGVRHEDELVQALNTLTEQVHPLALGNVHRFYSQSRMMAKKLLRLHMKQAEEHIIEEITETLTSKLFFHGHPINREEAKAIKLKIDYPDEELEKLIWSLYETYEEELEMDSNYDPKQILNSSETNEQEVILKGACVQSVGRKDLFELKTKIIRPPLPQNAPLQLQLQASLDAIEVPLEQKWTTTEIKIKTEKKNKKVKREVKGTKN